MHASSTPPAPGASGSPGAAPGFAARPHWRPPPAGETEANAFRVNAMVVAVVGAILGFPYILLGASEPSMLPGFLTGEAMLAGLIWRRRNPRRMLLIVTIAGIAAMVLVRYPTIFLIAIPVAVYSYARWMDAGPRLVLGIGFAASVLGPLSWFPGLVAGGSYPDEATLFVLFVLVCAFLVVTPYAFGRRIRDAALVQQQRDAADAEQYRTMLATRAHATRMAEMNTRAQIARELHDIVAHSVSVMIVQAEGGKALATKKPEAAAEVLGTIAETGREALSEMRRLVGVLRGAPDEAAEYAPSPGLDDLPAMVERAGERVQLVMHGDRAPISSALGLTVFRVAQEGVTNFLKHAGPDARCVVTLDQSPAWITVSVEDDGRGASSNTDGGGHGLRGMEERVAAMGGTIVARAMTTPVPGAPHGAKWDDSAVRTGFLVRATMPISAPGEAAHRLAR